MTYFYGQLFATDHEVRAMFPAAMDEQRRRSFAALARIARGAGEGAGGQDSAALDSYLQDLGRAHRKFAEVRLAELGPDAGLIGAADLARIPA